MSSIVSRILKVHSRYGLQIVFREAADHVVCSSQCLPALPRRLQTKRTRIDTIYNIHQQRYFTSNRVAKNVAIVPDKHQAYKRAINSILSSKKFEAIHSSMQSQGLWTKNMYTIFHSWISSPDILLGHDSFAWEQLREDWLGQSQNEDELKAALMYMLNMQRDAFQETMIAEGFPTGESLASFFLSTKMVFAEFVNQCRNEPHDAMIVWSKVKECGVILDESTSETLLSSFCRETKRRNEGLRECTIEFAMYHEVIHKKTERTTSLRAMELLNSGNPAMAESLLISHGNKSQITTEALAAVLRVHCKLNNINAAVSLFKRLRKRRRLKLSMDMHILLISTIAKNGCFR